MDLIASRLACDAKAKTKPTKSVKRLSKNESKESKKRPISKVDSKGVGKTSNKQKDRLTEISLKKKQLLKESFVESQKSKIKDKSKGIFNSTLKNKKKVLTKDATKSQNDLVSKPKKVAKSSSMIKNKVNLPAVKSKNVKTSSIEQIASKIGSAKKKVKSSKKLKNQIVKSDKLDGNETHDIKSKKRKAHIEKDSNNLKLSKKVKKQPAFVETENNEEIKNIKSKKRKVKTQSTFDTTLSRKEVINYVKALIKVVENEEQKKKNLFNSEKPPIFLLVNCVKVPKVPLHQHRITLPHSMVSLTDDVALFVKDLKKGRRRDYEDTVHHYEDILQQHGCTRVKTVIPINQVKTEYRQFEMRRRLLSSYDYFLVDGRISGHMAHLLGKHFREKRKLPTSIHMEKKDLKIEIDDALQKTSLQIHGHGDSSIVQVGSCSMNVEQIAENILAVIEDLSKNFPGGWENIRSLRIKTPLSLAIPIYITLKNRNDVNVPVQTPKRPKAYQDVEGELSTFISNVKVIVAPDGTVNVQKVDNNSDEEDSKETIEKDNSKAKQVKVKKESKDRNEIDDDDEEDD